MAEGLLTPGCETVNLPLTNSEAFVVVDADDDRRLALSAMAWRLDSRGYPVTMVPRAKGVPPYPQPLCRLILGLVKGDRRQVLHRNGQLDCRRISLVIRGSGGTAVHNGDVVRIPLTNSPDFALVNAWTYRALKFGNYEWGIKRGGYVGRMSYSGGKRILTTLHTLIGDYKFGGAGTEQEYDHADLNKLNNLDGNIRLATHPENCSNTPHNGGYDDQRGVYRQVDANGRVSYLAMVSSNNEVVLRAVFSTAEEAVAARDEAAIKYHGLFARLNHPADGQAQAVLAARRRKATGRHRPLTLEDRTAIEDGLRAGITKHTIAKQIGRTSAVIWQEVRRNSVDGVYEAALAHGLSGIKKRMATTRRYDTRGRTGVFYVIPSGKIAAEISVNGRRQYIGVFVTMEEAQRAWDIQARAHYGTHARLYFPESGERSMDGKIVPLVAAAPGGDAAATAGQQEE